MSLSRTALRLATVEALSPTGVSPADLPTIAGRRVYDSRMDPIDDLAKGQQAPVVVVYTEYDVATPGEPQGGPPFRRRVTLSIEISVVAMAESPENPATFEPMVPVTDGETEAALDLLEAGIRYSLLYGPTGRLFRKVTGSRIVSIESTPHRATEEAIRLALRAITLQVYVDDDCFDILRGLSRLPEPLASVVAALPAGAYGKTIAEGLAAFAPKIIPPGPLSKVGLVVDAHGDGRTDVSASVDIPQD